MDTTEFKSWRGSRPISTAMPVQRELELTEELESVLRNEFNQFESTKETEYRCEVLAKLSELVEEWVMKIYEKKNLLDIYARRAGAQIFTFGSFRLDVSSPGSDIDTLILTCENIDRETDFFEDLYQMLMENSNVTELVRVRESFVPVMNMMFYGIPFDLTFARLPIPALSVPMMDIDDDGVVDLIDSEDEKSVRSLNGRRVTDKTLSLVPCQKTFRLALRCIKQWAKLRCVYSNAVGFLGGIAWSLLVARICQLYPNATASTIVSRFFALYSSNNWTWTDPVLLAPIKDTGKHARLVCIPSQMNKPIMFVVTPAYPSQNSTNNVCKSTLCILCDEMDIAHKVMVKIDMSEATWSDFFRPCNFLNRYGSYLQLDCFSNDSNVMNSWLGFIESRLRFLVTSLERESFIEVAHSNPHRFIHSASASDGNDGDDVAFEFNGKKWKFSTSFFMGLEISLNSNSKSELNLNNAIKDFYLKVAEKRPDRDGPLWDVDFVVLYLKRSQIPDWAFPDGKRYAPETLRKRRRLSALTLVQQIQEKKNKIQQSIAIPGTINGLGLNTIVTSSNNLMSLSSPQSNQPNSDKNLVRKRLDQSIVPSFDPFNPVQKSQVVS